CALPISPCHSTAQPWSTGMSDWRRWATRMAHSVERRVDETRARLAGAQRGARRIVAYRGFGNADEVFASGRVLANPPPAQGSAADGWWRNLRTMLRHLESDEVPGARVQLAIAGTRRDAVTDEEGFFRLWIRPSRTLAPTQLWHTVGIEVTE